MKISYWWIGLFIGMALLKVSSVFAQTLRLEEGTIQVYHYEFKRSAGSRGGNAYDKHLIRTRIDNQGWNCSRIDSGNDPNKFHSLNKQYAGAIIYQGGNTFTMEIDIANGRNSTTDGDNCENGVTNSKHRRTITENVSFSSLSFNRQGIAYETINLENTYWVIYEFRLTPKNTLDFQVSNGGASTQGPLCLNQLAAVTMDGSTTGPYQIASITYEFLYDNQQRRPFNSKSCRNENENYSDCYTRCQGSNPDDPSPLTPLGETRAVPIDGGNDCTCCSQERYLPVEYQWRPLGTINASKDYLRENIDFADHVSGIWENITDAGKSIRFRSKLRLKSGQETDWAVSGFYTLYPGMPALDPTPVSLVPACFGQENGKVTFKTTHNVDLAKLERQSNLAVSLIDLNKNEDVSIARNEVVFSGNRLTLSQIRAGNYEMVVRFAGNNDLCTVVLPFTMTELGAFTLAEVQTTDAVCFNGTGEATVKLYDATGWQGVDFTLNEKAVVASALPTETMGGRTVRVYHLTGLSASASSQILRMTLRQQLSGQSCSPNLTQSITITAPDPVTANAPDILPATCNADYRAGLFIENMRGGSGEYLAQVLGENGQEIARAETDKDTITVWAKQSGEWEVVVSDRNAPACQGARFSVQLTPLEAMAITDIATQNNACTGVSEGIIQGQFSGTSQGVVSLYRAGELLAEQSSSPWSFENLPAGTYQVQVRRSPTCYDIVEEEILIEEPTPFAITFDEVPISCQDAGDATLTATINSFGLDYEYRWYKDDQAFPVDSLVLEELAPGDYRLEVTPFTASGRACEPYRENYVVVEPTTVSAHVSYDSLLCLNPATNDLRITALHGGSGLFNISVYRDGALYDEQISYAQEHYTLGSLEAGQYQLALRDAQRPACIGYDTSFWIAPVAPLALDATVLRHNDCYGAKEGIIQIDWQGNRAFLRLSNEAGIQLDTLLRDNQRLFVDTLAAGTYTLELYRRPGCDELETTSFTITEPTELLFDYTKTDIACFGLPTGQIRGTLSGATPPYQWSWQRNGTLLNIKGTGSALQLDSLIDGAYTLEVTDANGCLSTFTVDIVPLTQPLQTTLTGREISCYQAADGAIVATVVGGEAPYQYQWTDKAQTVLSSSGPQVAIQRPGYYYLQVTDNFGCQHTDSLYVYEPPGIDFPDEIRICKDQSYRAVLEYPEADVTYRWQADNGFSATQAETLLDQAGNYRLSVTRPNGCELTHDFRVRVLDVAFMASFAGASWIEQGDTVYLKEISQPRPDSTTWVFDPALTVRYDSLGDPLITTPEPGEYTVGMYGYKDSCMAYVAQKFIFYPAGEGPQLQGPEDFGPQGVKEFAAYPNPSNGPFRIKVVLQSAAKTALFLYDLNGEEQWRGQREAAPEHHFELTDKLKDNTYILLLVTPGARQSLKIIIAR